MFAPGQERPAAKRRWQPEPEFKINALLEQGDAVVDALVAAKTAITKANAPIQESIYRLAELKSAVAFLQRLDTTHGKSPLHVLTSEALDYTAQVRAAEVETRVGRFDGRSMSFRTAATPSTPAPWWTWRRPRTGCTDFGAGMGSC